MDEFKPEDELKPDPSDRRTGRSRQSSERDNEPQINFDDVDLDADDRRPSRSRNARNEREDEEYESEEELMDEQPVERRPRKRKKAVAAKPASRQYIMMGLGVLVLVLLIVGIGSALKAPSTHSTEQTASVEKSIDLSGNDASNQANGAQPAPGTTSAEQTAGNTSAGQDISLPPVSATPTQGQAPVTPEGQQRVEVQGDLNNALTQPQNQEQVNTAVVNSTLPTEPATVAPVHGSNAQQQTVATETKPRHTQTAPRQERKQAVIEPKRETKPQTVAKAPETKAPAQTKPAVSQPVKAPTPAATAAPKATATTTAPAATAAPAATPTASTSSTAAGKTTGNVGSLKSASSSNYTLQLSSSSNYDNLNAWAKKSNLKNYVVYQTTRNGQPWYVLVSGVYASKDEAKRAVSTLPADVQAKNPWAKPIHQVQADLK
ncbi:cell division protein DamX [Enterobacter hormaechei subsp. hoffmannii]|uniref:cell division protein DamX n=1 Tax=Enterobacter hormaechei TaxID=158836 RepID=UPI0011E45F99|nr:cell division protein DamX [Enterobacter hormaechei]MBA7864658.1 cell division protein DamX [Enterobacter hormaechei]MBT1926168.1 cell division protein DamX [Enterobacter hormaechei subsp. hoffmannii]MBT1931005.1 cell division protein DamX [Enterobacter hormaechei subsp. hoffmannii]MBT1954508.1 cell division protein DamX [Enterobacter hormaechei subsp. hoffmannii]MBT1959395.1 cell division protein DamX [Enterobacter hormaechei subsp. hoffmannii]